MEDYLNKLQNNDENLVELDLYRKNIGETGAIAICQALKVNTHLQKLNISGNNIGENGAIAISRVCFSLSLIKWNNLEALKVNICLRRLHIKNNKNNKTGTNAIRNALEYNYTLEKIFGINAKDLVTKKNRQLRKRFLTTKCCKANTGLISNIN